MFEMPKGVYVKTEEHRRKISKGLLGNKNFLGRKHSNETKLKISESRRGEKNPAWKGIDVSYRALHDWIQKNFGTPSKCEFCGRERKGKWMHWANKSGQYRRNRNDWLRLCASCHKEYDRQKRKKS